MDKIESTKEFQEIVEREGYKLKEIIIPFEKGVPKSCGVFEKNNNKFFIKGAGIIRKYQIDREVVILQVINNLRLNKNLVIPRYIFSKHKNNCSFLVEEFLHGYEKTWGDEEIHYKTLINVMKAYSKIKENPLPTTFDKKHLGQIEKIRNLPEKYKKPLKIARINLKSFSKRYYEALKSLEPLEEGIKFTLTHNDINGNNFLYNRENKKYALVDFERTDFGALFCDIGRLIVFSALNWNLKREKFEKEIYQSKLYEPLQELLNEKERKLLKFYLLLDNLKRINFYEDFMKDDKNYKNAITFSKKYIKWAIKNILNE